MHATVCSRRGARRRRVMQRRVLHTPTLSSPSPPYRATRCASGGSCTLGCRGHVVVPQLSRHAGHHSEASRAASSAVSPIFMAPSCKQARQNAAGWLASGQPGGRFSAPEASSGTIEHRAQLMPSHHGADAGSWASRAAAACIAPFSAGVQSPSGRLDILRRRTSSAKGVKTCGAARAMALPGSGEHSSSAPQAPALGIRRRFLACLV